MASKRNLVLGAIRGYRFEQLKPFVVSLKRTDFSGDLVFLYNHLSSETLNSLQEHGVTPVPFAYRGSGALNSWSRFWPVLSPVVRPFNGSGLGRTILKNILPLQTARFFHYREYLESHRNEYQYVLLTDVRDVLFQADPFLDFHAELMAFEESNRVPLKDEKMFNAGWIEHLFGREALEQIGRYPVLCSGTIMGEINAVIEFLAEFERALLNAKNIGEGGSDQGLHNYLCRKLVPGDVEVCGNGAGSVLTMVPGLVEGVDFEVGESGEVLGSNGRPISVLHQYDRHPALAMRLLQQLSISTKPEFKKCA
jgi:hypothetical protein